MQTKQLNPLKALNKAFLKVKPNRDDIEHFKSNLVQMLDRIDEKESEEFHKNLISQFLKDTYFKESHYINVKGRNDLVIHNGNSAQTTVGVILEVKNTTNRHEMFSGANFNTKSFHELILYYLRERITKKNLEIRHVIITNVYEWYIFDANLFERLFAENKELVKNFEDFENGRLSGKTTDFFYKEIAYPYIQKLTSEIEYTNFDLRDYETVLRNQDKSDDNKLIPLFKILSREHLLKLPFANDSNSLDKSFYGELLHIIGLTETVSGGKKLIERNKDGQRHSASLLEDAIIQLDTHDKIRRLNNPEQYGADKEERSFNIALTLCITWINRILFLKLLEAQLLTYHKGEKKYAFLSLDKIKEYDDLNSLFFQVLARRYEERNEDVRKLFENIPYLNSSLFEPTDVEHETLFISNLKDRKLIPVYSSTVLKNNQGKRLTGEMPTLEYLFAFLNAYDFSSEGSEEIQEDNKTLINASVLGLIFEKINGYKDGSFFTPSTITMYMCRESIRRAVIQKFNEVKGWNCSTIDELFNNIEDRPEANNIINSIKICDPAVGSGHFLVSSLNELIALKSYLKVLSDRSGKLLNYYDVDVVNDELIVTDQEGGLFTYNPNNKETQRVQEALFHEKQTLIENCLFGVDINQNSVKICRLRLWIELLKNAYYKNNTELETLPNIDINIKAGNSLISRFALDTDLGKHLKKFDWTIETYKEAVQTYRNPENKDQKREMESLISNIKKDFRSEIYKDNKKVRDLEKVLRKLHSYENQYTLFERREVSDTEKDIKELIAEKEKLEKEIEDIKNNKIYDNAFEWRFEFPEVLDNEANFKGFDLIIGNPPYIKEYKNRAAFDGIRGSKYYQGKMDIWYAFVSNSIDLLKDNGILSFIAQNNWVTSKGASKLRNKILSETKIDLFVDFHNYKVFDAAGIQTMIFLLRKKMLNESYSINYFLLEDDKISNSQLAEFLDFDTQTTFGTKFHYTMNPLDYIDKVINFNSSEIEKLLQKIEEKGTFKLFDSEVAQGIVAPQDFVNSYNANLLGLGVKKGDGVFVISTDELLEMKLSESERKLIKPYFTSRDLDRHYSHKQNSHWIIYTDSKFKNADYMKRYPALKSHLDKFTSIITSDNKPYGLHRSREERFFKGEKIMSLRKTNLPNFTFTDFDCYVSQSYFIIKTERINLKILTLFLNSALISFWLKHKGKTQGSSLQIDKEPLLRMPIISTVDEKKIKILISLFDDIVTLRKQNKDIYDIQKQIDTIIFHEYELTFEEIELIGKIIFPIDFQSF